MSDHEIHTTSPCGHSGCPRPAKARGLCNTHWWQMHHHRETWDVGSRRPSLTDPQVDGALLLIAMGATTDEVASQVGISSGKSLTAHLRKHAAPGLRDAVSARQARPHGTLGRYRRGCRCHDCRKAKRLDERARRGEVESNNVYLRDRTGARTIEEARWQHRMHARQRDAELLDQAGHRYEQWTGPQIEAALARTEDDSGWLRPSKDVARLTGRTTGGVAYIRRRATDPRVRSHL